jgi:hypothetical protein
VKTNSDRTPAKRAWAPDRTALLLALSAHALPLMLVWSMPEQLPEKPRATREVAPSTSTLDNVAELEVNVDLGGAVPLDPSEAERPPVSPLAVTSRAARRTLGTPALEASSLSSETTPGAVIDSPQGSWTFSPLQPVTAPDLSLGISRYRVAVPEQTRGASDSASGERRPFAAADPRDLALGLGRGGPVRSAVQEAVQASDSGVLGLALFDVTLGQAGEIQVDLVEAKGDTAPWDRLRDSIARLVAGKAVRLPETGHGLRVRVRVDAAERFADGREARSLGTDARVTPGEAGTDSVAMKEMPNVHAERRGKVCSGRVAIGPSGGDLAAGTNFGRDTRGQAPQRPGLATPLTISGGCSPENIGGSARRVVAAQVIGETHL